ncbi:hypothetical protein OQA88_207 [Cercophora sp. LCS_1]
MSELRPLEALQALHGELLAVLQHRFEGLQTLEQLLEENTKAFKRFLDKKPRDNASRTRLGSGKIKLGDDGEEGEEYQINSQFVDDALRVAEELDLDEIEAARILLDADAEGDTEVWGRPLWACGVLRFHQERRFLLDCMRLMIEIAADEELDDGMHDAFGALVEERVFRVPLPGQPPAPREDRIVQRCMKGMAGIKERLQKLGEKAVAQNLLHQAQLMKQIGEQQETWEFSRVSLVEQHELLAVILVAAIDKRHAEVADFKEIIAGLKKADRYDHLLVHMFPVLGTFVTVYGSSEGIGDMQVSRELNGIICKPDDDSWTMPALCAAVRAWWIAEYSGWYLDDTPALNDPNINLDQEDAERTKQFLDSLKDGAFDFILAVAADSKTQEWQDPTRSEVRQWLRRKAPPLNSDFNYPFNAFFQKSLMVHLEVLIDASISNLPDILRKLRIDEDEQRQLSQAHEQDLDLERFLIIIAYAYEGRPDAAMSFWEDPESNLAGFLQWASRRASTPLVSAFCEMLQALSDNDECATAAHTFLLDEGHQSTGKMKRSLSLTWHQVFKELQYFTAKLKERSSPSQAHTHRAGKPTPDQAETEPESALMLECYLRLIAKLCTESEVARLKLLTDEDIQLVDTLFRLSTCTIPPRMRACAFYALKALMTRKTQGECDVMWRWTDNWLNGGFGLLLEISRGAIAPQNMTPDMLMENMLNQFGNGFDEPNALVQFFTSLFVPVEGYEGLNDILPFPEDLGGAIRMTSVEIYVDFIVGHIFGTKSKEITEPTQQRIMRLSCLDFALTSLTTFNEDLIVLGNETNGIAIDKAISTTDLATYVRLHPFARTMEWMFNEKVISALMATIHQDPATLSMATPDSPLVASILRAVELILKVLELQDTYLDLVKPAIKSYLAKKKQTRARPAVANAAFGSFEDGIMSHLTLVVDLGRLCALQNPPLTLACLKLLEKISTSSKIISAWNPDTGMHGHRNKAIVQLEKNGENETIAGTLSGEISSTLDPILEAEAPNYSIKIFILDFLYECLNATPDRPTIAHLLLGFSCELNALTIEPRGAFDTQRSLFHNLLTILISLTVSQEDRGIRGYLVGLKYRILRVFQVLWSSPLSARLVMEELRETNFLFHMLLQEVQIQPGLVWDNMETANPEFPLSDAAVSYINFLNARGIVFEYIGKELCSVSQKRIPTIKRQIFDALNGQVKMEGEELLRIPNIFDFFDFLSLDGVWDIPVPTFQHMKDLDLKACVDEVPNIGLQYDMKKVQEVLSLKRNEGRNTGQVIAPKDLAEMEQEEALLVEYLIFSNRQRQYAASRLKLLRSWTNTLLVMFEANEFQGTPKMAFLLQALQGILPSLEAYSALSASEAYELARVAKVLLFKLDLISQEPAAPTGLDKETFTIGNLISDKLFQLFQICLDSIGKWAGSPELRAVYYSICYRYLTAVVDKAAAAKGNRSANTARHRTLKAIHAHGERLINVICDDAYGSDTSCQTAAMVLLGAMVHVGRADDDTHVIEALNRLNFIGVLVDSLKTILSDWLSIIVEGNPAAEQYAAAKLSLLLHLCQTKQGAKYVVQANLFRALELSNVFAADPELEIDPTNFAALEKHYSLLVSLARIVGAAVLARGAHNIPQGRRFLTQHRMLVVHALKRSAGIGILGGPETALGRTGGNKEQEKLEEQIEELAEAFMVLITATGFLEFENDTAPAEKPRGISSSTLFH